MFPLQNMRFLRLPSKNHCKPSVLKIRKAILKIIGKTIESHRHCNVMKNVPSLKSTWLHWIQVWIVKHHDSCNFGTKVFQSGLTPYFPSCETTSFWGKSLEFVACSNLLCPNITTFLRWWWLTGCQKEFKLINVVQT